MQRQYAKLNLKREQEIGTDIDYLALGLDRRNKREVINNSSKI